MSEVADRHVATSRAVSPQSGYHHETDRSTAKTFSFFGQRRRSGVTQGWAGVSLLVTGSFLLSQVATTHAVTVQVAILGSICVVSGLGFLALCVRDLFGRLIIDESGITIRPTMVGESIGWNEVAGWEVRPDSSRYPEACTVLIWTQDDPCALFIPNNWLTGQDRIELRRMLQTYAPEKDRGAYSV